MPITMGYASDSRQPELKNLPALPDEIMRGIISTVQSGREQAANDQAAITENQSKLGVELIAVVQLERQLAALEWYQSRWYGHGRMIAGRLELENGVIKSAETEILRLSQVDRQASIKHFVGAQLDKSDVMLRLQMARIELKELAAFVLDVINVLERDMVNTATRANGIRTALRQELAKSTDAIATLAWIDSTRLVPDADNWTNLDGVAKAVQEDGYSVDRANLMTIVTSLDFGAALLKEASGKYVDLVLREAEQRLD